MAGSRTITPTKAAAPPSSTAAAKRGSVNASRGPRRSAPPTVRLVAAPAAVAVWATAAFSIRTGRRGGNRDG